jgi:hypothetical protein
MSWSAWPSAGVTGRGLLPGDLPGSWPAGAARRAAGRAGRCRRRRHGDRDRRCARVWPPELFAPLRAVGIGLTEERFADARALNRAHPGANPLWWARTDPWRAVLGIALGVIIVAVTAAVVRLA